MLLPIFNKRGLPEAKSGPEKEKGARHGEVTVDVAMPFPSGFFVARCQNDSKRVCEEIVKTLQSDSCTIH